MDSPFFTLSIPYRLSVWQYDTPLSTKMNRIRSVFAEMCCLLLAFVAFWKSGGPFLGEPGLRAGLDEKGVRSLQPEQSFKQMRLLPLRPLQRGTLIFALRKLDSIPLKNLPLPWRTLNIGSRNLYFAHCFLSEAKKNNEYPPLEGA